TELLIGSPVEGYQNHNLTHISIGNNTLLKVIDIRNCPNLTEPLDASGCINVREIYAEGTSISMAVLPAAGILEILHLPSTVTNLTIRNQAMLTGDGLVLAGLDHIETLVLENMNSIDQPALIRSLLVRSLTYVRLTGLDIADDNLSLFHSLAQLQGVDENGMNTAHAVVTGRVSVPSAWQSQIDELESVFPELEISAEQILADPVTTLVFTSNNTGQTLQNTSFTCNRPWTQVNATTFEVAAAIGTVLQFTFTADNHKDRTATYTVSTSRTQGYAMIYMPLVTFIFKRFDSGAPLEGVTVTINGQDFVSDEDGKICLRETGSLAGTAEHDYGIAAINQTVTGYDDQTFNITVQPYIYPKVRVSLSGGLYMPVMGAVLTFNGKEYVTDYNGFIPEIKTVQGSFPFQVAYQDLNTNLSYSLSPSTPHPVINAQIDYSKINYAEMDFGQPDGSIRIICLKGDITVNSTDDAYVIDWGLGYETPASGAGSKSYSFPDGVPDCTFIKIRNCDNVTSLSFGNDKILAMLSVGNSRMDFAVPYAFTAGMYGSLRIAGSDLFKAGMAKAGVDLTGAFSGRTNLLAVQEHLFDGLNITSLASCFSTCRYLGGIPEGLFRDAVECIDFKNVFREAGIYSYKQQYLDIQDVFPDVQGDFSYAFYGSGLVHIRESLFAGITFKPGTGSYLLHNCKQLLTAVIPEHIPFISGFFNGCSKLQWVELKYATPPSIDEFTFGNASSTFLVYVPDSALDAYREAARWSSFAERILPASSRV
ncbi:MAG: hypothetical protein LBK22_07690, partial [Tannerella sp.]|nr:hypothetical protein [Tannerella sp.]